MSGKCESCGRVKEIIITVRVNYSTGFMEVSKNIDVCGNCIKHTSRGDFLKYRDGVFYDRYGIQVFNQIVNEEEIDRIFNPEKYAVLDWIEEES